MTVSTLILAVAATIVGSVFTLYTSARIRRETGRTAARLIYGELIRNSASIAYYLRLGSWPPVHVETPVWNQQGEAIAKIRKVDAFNTIYKGYAALEALAFLAKEGVQLGEERESILREEVGRLRDAIRMAGTTARIDEDEIAANLEPFDTERVPLSPAGPVPFRLPAAAGVIPPALLRHVVTSGTATQRESARQTIDVGAPADRAPVQSAPQPNRVIFDAKGSDDWFNPGTVVRREGEPATGDPAVDEMYDAMGLAHRFFWDVYELDLQKYNGTQMEAVVHFGTRFNNMFWDGTKVIVGDGDGELFHRFSKALDTVGHELFHAVVQTDTGLRFQNQAGALTEAICDVFGTLLRQYDRNQAAAAADWLVGAGLLVGAPALRSLKAPGTAYDTPELGADPQVAHMKDYVSAAEDSGGVRINAGIPAHAFYVLASALGGFAWDPAGRIWLEALSVRRLRSAAGFATFAANTVMAARRRYGEDGPEQEAVLTSWREVGVRVRASALNPTA